MLKKVLLAKLLRKDTREVGLDLKKLGRSLPIIRCFWKMSPQNYWNTKENLEVTTPVTMIKGHFVLH